MFSFADDVEFRARWRNDEAFRNTASSKYGWTDDEARGIIIRESGWVKVRWHASKCMIMYVIETASSFDPFVDSLLWTPQPKPGYKPVCCGNDCADVFYITGSLLILYIAYALFFTAMYFFWLHAQDGALYTFGVLMFVYWLTVATLVYFGGVEIEKAAQEADRLEEERLKAEAEAKKSEAL